MELKKHFSKRVYFLIFYYLAFCGYLAFGFLSAGASSYHIDNHLIIPSINLSSGVTKVEISDGNLPTPDYIVGSFATETSKEFLFGHSSTVFADLKDIKIGDEIIYDNKTYIVTSYHVYEKSEIHMDQVLSPTERDSLTIMTCAGEDYGNGDSSHRLIINAILR